MLPLLLVIFAAFLLLERLLPGRALPTVPTWTIRVLGINALQLLVVGLAGLSWNRWLTAYSVFHLSDHVPAWAGGLLAYVAATFVFYWWHRWRHTVDWLWQCLHQIHHSAQRIEVSTSFYKHPVETLVNLLIGGLFIYTLLGLSAEAGLIYTLCTTVSDFFYHSNVRTPHWVGYVFQRPEMHRLHHQYEKHAGNYGDIVWWDMLFGTYYNPEQVDIRCGFDTPRELRLLDMLRFRDVHKDHPAPKGR
ncbi:sterol desaturase family protein [Hymenobacter aquaticus]|uniref:Sterol desaturase family protein n=1 Tax=Hymenobacter aquaticus TaxID=1867101 RepID=A0A4Z0Q774_9BACT|nr:sterol desaturase family protein [Hymenobacter aquaticus]TGE24993.1 sterol desaturase family protein [Hymenobacter aquaticus]